MNKAIILFLFFSISTTFAQTSDRFIVRSVGTNTKNNEFGVILTSDGSVFYSKSTFDNSKDFNEKSANLYKGVLEVKGEISKGLKFPTDATHAVFTNDGKTVYYSKKSSYKTFQLYRASVDHTGRWKNNSKLPFNNPNNTFKQPALNADNTKLFFASDLPGSYGKTDIYYVTISNRGLEFSEPINLGEDINTTGIEIYPFLSKKDKLFFSSDSRNSMGGLDVYESFEESGSYTNATNLGDPINSTADDFGYVLIPDTNKGYVSSNRQDGFGGVDIYYFEDKKPSLNKCSQAINGIVKNKQTKKEIFEATVEIFSSVDHMETVLTNFKGEFNVENVECDERYDIVTYKEGYNGFAEVQTIPKNGEQIILYLDPEFPEGFEEEFDFSNEMVVYDTQTDKIVKTEADIEKENSGSSLSFAEKREQDRIEKERIKREQIEAEAEVERMEAQKLEAERMAIVNAQRAFAEKEKLERIARAKSMAEQLRKEKELALNEENKQIEANRLAEEKTLAEKQKALNIAKEKEAQEKIEATRLAQVELDKQQKLEAERISQELAEEKREEAAMQANLIAQREAAEKERQERISRAKETAEKLRVEKEIAFKEKNERDEANRLADEKTRTEKQIAEKLAQEKETQEKIEAARMAEVELNKQQKLDAEKIAQELAEKEKIETEKQANLVAQQDLVEQERQNRIAQAKETANRLRKEQAEADSTLNKVVEANEERQQKITQTETTLIILEKEQETAQSIQAQETNEEVNQATQLERKRLEDERSKLIAQAKATAERLRKEQIEAEKEIQLKAAQKKEREEKIAEAQETAKALHEENEMIASNEIKQKNTDEPTEVSIHTKKVTPDTTTQEEIAEGDTSVDTVAQSETEIQNNERCARDIHGVIQSSSDMQTLAGATVDIYFDGQNIESTKTDESGAFHFINVDCDTKYTLICFKKEFNNIAKADVNTASVPDLIVLLLDPDPELIAEKAALAEEELVDEQATTEKNIAIRPAIENTSIVNHGEEKEVVQSEPEKTAEIEEEKEITQIQKEEEEEEEDQTIIKEGKIQINPIYFDLDEHYLTLPARRELDKIIVTLRQNPTMIIESGSHTDTRGPFDYNLNLSEKRSQETVGYLVANGADPDRISGRGYGETMPLNHCLDGVKCSEKEHLKNRRTEFVILKY